MRTASYTHAVSKNPCRTLYRRGSLTDLGFRALGFRLLGFRVWGFSVRPGEYTHLVSVRLVQRV